MRLVLLLSHLLLASKNDYTLPLCEKVMGIDLGIETFATSLLVRK